MSKPIRVTVWHEYRHEHKSEAVRKLYPDGMHMVMKEGLEQLLGDQVKVTTATLDQDENHGLSDELLENTDVMTWWGHAAHAEVKDEIVEKVWKRVVEGGMGLLVLHSGHFSKIFRKLMGTGCGLRWREAAEREILWNVNPGHPITEGVGDYIDLPHVEMYGELFDIPTPDELIFISWFEGGEVFRSGATWTRGKGKVFYFRPGHETFPLYYNEQVRRVLANGVQYVAPKTTNEKLRVANAKNPLNPIKSEHEVDESIHKH